MANIAKKQSSTITDDPKRNDLKKDQIKSRVTPQYMTKFERAQVIGARAALIAKGDKPAIDTCGETNAVIIATKELDAGKINATVRRHLRDGLYEDWHVNDLRKG
jgi:DNA-directed RNA polymerase I, II, and III subunit RPABC2